MLDLDLISNDIIKEMRDRSKVVTWSKRMKDAGQKAALTRLRNATTKLHIAAGLKAAATLRSKKEQRGKLPVSTQ